MATHLRYATAAHVTSVLTGQRRIDATISRTQAAQLAGAHLFGQHTDGCQQRRQHRHKAQEGGKAAPEGFE